MEAILDSKRLRRKRIAKKAAMHIALQAILILTALMYLYIFVWMVATALKTDEAFAANPATIFVANPQWRVFFEVTQAVAFFRYVLNTLILAAGTVTGTVVSGSLVAFSFAKLRWKGRNICFMILLATMMLSTQVLQIPTFVLFANLGWIDTFLPIIIPTFFGGSAFAIFLTREFYKGASNELIAAAKIDGCGYFRIWRLIMLPLSLPITVTVALLTFMGTWNDFMLPLIYIHNSARYPITLGLRAFHEQFSVQWNMVMAGAVLSMLPTLVLFFAFQKYFMEGISVSSGLKG